MVLFVSAIFLSLFAIAISQLNYAQCEPKHFAEEMEDIFQFAALHSSSKQPYFAANRTIKSSELNAKNAIKIWMFVRHGSRTGQTHETNVFKSFEDGLRAQIIRNLENVTQCPLSENNWKKLKKWKWDSQFEADRVITESGKAELKKIAENLKARFPILFNVPFNKSNFNAVCTDEPRTKVSAAAFVDAIVGSQWRSNVLSVSNDEENKIIRAFTYPPYIELYRKRNKHGNALLERFFETDTFLKVVEDVSNRLNFNDGQFDIGIDRVLDMHSLCQFEGTWTPGGKSVWCSMFTKDELLVLEYSHDLYRFIDCSPFGGEVNRRAHCLSVRDMMTHLSISDGPKVTTYFTHSAAILLHMTAMGAFEGIEELTVEYDKESRADRRWNISRLDPMASNFVAVLYKHNQVKFFLNDKIVHLPGCNEGLCDVAFLQTKFTQCYY
ncbi:multiple inositol polyphosphate phosphatase 1-like [Contarinia nasturtii]|uniref:multiple inositol polyphosphate phosphatase 1-like n=1 Tax=Contarinia nasturtii TaxID=265458 RepID=UPI0012D407A0|nr:multiple inositol polyphosphate phosphatase 1-like [Contarinia nasturtii]